MSSKVSDLAVDQIMSSSPSRVTSGQFRAVMKKEDLDTSGKYGQPHEYDEKFTGPIEKRSCTDIFCLFLLIGFIIGWCAIAGIAFKNGDPEILVSPVDSRGQKCGFDESVKDRPYLYFFDITKCAKATVVFKGCLTPQVCVKKCPDPNEGEIWTVIGEIAKRKSEEEIKAELICKDGVDKTSQTLDQLIATPRQQCASFIIPSKTKRKQSVTRNFTAFKVTAPAKAVKSVFSRRCIPSLKLIEGLDSENSTVNKTSLKAGVIKLLDFFNAKENLEMLFDDLRASWVVILACLAAGAVICLIWICAMRVIAGVMVWLSLGGMIFVLGFSCYYSVEKYTELSKLDDTKEFREDDDGNLISDEEFLSQQSAYFNLQSTWLAFSILTGVFLFVLLFIVIVLGTRLAIAVELIKQGANAVSDMCFTLVWPLVPWALQVIVVGWFLLVGVYLATATEEVFRVDGNCTCGTTNFQDYDSCTPKKFMKTLASCPACQDVVTCIYQNHQKLQYAKYFHGYNIFGLIWLLCCVSDFGDMVLAGCFAGWYWTFNRKKNLPAFPVANSIYRTTRYHLGTAAFGSLLVSIIKAIRYFLEYLDQKAKQYGPDNPIATAIFKCLKCCFWCLEKFLKFINRNAYIMCAVYGKSFCESAKEAFYLIARNPVRAFVLDQVSDFLLFLGKVAVTGFVAICSFFLFTNRFLDKIHVYIPELNFYFVPVILITCGVYCIATVFFSVYEMAVDTLFLCFLEDCERNDGSQEKPFFMPKELLQILGAENKEKEKRVKAASPSASQRSVRSAKASPSASRSVNRVRSSDE